MISWVCPAGLGRCLLLVAAGLGLAPATRASLWTLDNGMDARVEVNDNVNLAPQPPGTVGTLVLGARFTASRQSETDTTRLDGGLSDTLLRGALAQELFEGHLTLSQNLSLERDRWDFSLGWRQDTTYANRLEGADLVLGRGLRATESTAAAWTHALTERLALQGRVTLGRTHYAHDLSGAVDYLSGDLSASMQYQWDERSALSLQADHSLYRAQAGGTRSSTDSIGLSAQHQISERSTAGLNLGRYATAVVRQQPLAVCSLPLVLCQAGLYPYDVIQLEQRTTTHGLQFGGNLRLQLDEVSEVGLDAGRQTLPSGTGTVARNDSLAFNASRRLTPETSVSLDYSRSRSSFEGLAGAPTPVLQTLRLSLSRMLARDVSLKLDAQHTLSTFGPARPSARANSLALSLKIDWPGLAASR